MASTQRDTKKRRKSVHSGKRGSEKVSAARGKRKSGRPISLMASRGDVDRARETVDRILAFYRPLKKPVTLRLDADVLDWFKKDGARYQTRINRALRDVMERETKRGKG